MSQHTVLIIDDVSMARRAFTLPLRNIPQLRLLEAGNGADALQLICEQQVDLVCLDMRMPVMDGIDFLERMSSLPADQRPQVVLITTEDEPEVIERARGLGVTRYLTKPVDLPELERTVRELLGL